MLKNIIDTVLSRGAQSGDAFMLESADTTVAFENNSLKSTNRIQSRGVGLRVCRNNCLGFASSSDLRNPDEIAQHALDVAGSGEPIEINFPPPHEFDVPEDLVDDDVTGTSVDELIDSGWEYVKRVKAYDPGILASAALQTAKFRIGIANSEGLDASYEKTMFEASFVAQIIVDTTVIYCYRNCSGTKKNHDLQPLMERLIHDCRLAGTPANIVAGNYPVIFTPRAMVALFEFLRAGVNGRNVEKGISPIRDKIGEEILDDRITLFEHGLMPGGVSSAPFDDEGVAGSKKPIIEGGVLRTFITDLVTSGRLHDLPTGNGSRYNPMTGAQDYGSVPAPKPTNWILEHGDVSLADLKADLKEGVLIDDMMGLFTSNFLAGDFSGNISLGYLVKNGETIGRLKDTMVTGNLYRLLKDSLIDLTNEQETVNGSAVFPYVALKDVTITV